VQRFRGQVLAIALNNAGKIAHHMGAYSAEVGRQSKATGASLKHSKGIPTDLIVGRPRFPLVAMSGL
jgi:hypothetical protein